MKKIYLLLFFIMPAIAAFAQKDLPVVGNTATLIDLIKKDYNTLPADAKKDELNRDLTLAVSIFKAYLFNEQRQSLANHTLINVEELADKVEKAKKSLTYFTGVTIEVKDSNKTGVINRSILTATDDLQKAQQDLYNAQLDNNMGELTFLQSAYSSGNNKFLAYMVGVFIKKYGAIRENKLDMYAGVNTTSSVQKAIPFIGGDLAFQTAIDGLSKFLAKRIKEELTGYVIERIKVWLQNPSEDDPLAELKTLLPVTTAYLVGFTADRVSSFPNEIKQYIEDDLNHLIDNAPKLAGTPRIKKLISTHPDLDFAFEALEFIPSISKVKTPLDYFAILERSRNLSRWKQLDKAAERNIANTIYLCGMVARSLMVVDNGELRFASLNWLGGYVSEPSFFLLYTGFIYQQEHKYYNISLKKDPVTYELQTGLLYLVNNDPESPMTSFNEYKLLIEDLVSNIAKNTEKIYVMSSVIKKAHLAGTSVGRDTIHAYVKSVIGLSEDLTFSVNEFLKRLMASYNEQHQSNRIDQIDLVSVTQPYFAVAKMSNDVYLDLGEKRFAAALMKLVNIAASVSKDEKTTALITTIQSLGELQNNKYAVDWSKLIKLSLAYNSSDALRLTDKQLAAVKTVTAELSKIIRYNKINYPDSYLAGENGFSKFSGKLTLASVSAIIDPADVTVMREIFSRPDFQKLLVAYYTNTSIDLLLTRLKTELEEIKVTTAGNTEIKLFDPADVTNIINTLNTYIAALYNNYFLNGNTDEAEALAESKQQLFAILQSYITVLPQKLNIASSKQLVNIIHFVNEMALAKNSDEVANAIEAMALPSGSYALKREAKFNFTINSYPGILGACEFAGWGDRKPSIGFTAPVGFGLSWSTRGGAVNGVFLPVFDIGALTRLRLDNSSSSQTLPEFTFKNIVSPGIYYSHGFKKAPIALNVGMQYGPEWQGTDNVTMQPVKKEIFRLGIGIVLDIPLLNLHTTPRN